MSHPSLDENQTQADGAHAARKRTATHDVLLHDHEVARRQGRSVRTLRNQRVLGGGIPYLKLGRSVRYRLSDVLAWEEARRVSSTSDGGRSDA